MQQLTIEHKKSNNSKVVSSSEEIENKREGHGLNIALTRKVFRLQNTDTFFFPMLNPKVVIIYTTLSDITFQDSNGAHAPIVQ